MAEGQIATRKNERKYIGLEKFALQQAMKKRVTHYDPSKLYYVQETCQRRVILNTKGTYLTPVLMGNCVIERSVQLAYIPFGGDYQAANILRKLISYVLTSISVSV